jgi:hypothetical protein
MVDVAPVRAHASARHRAAPSVDVDSELTPDDVAAKFFLPRAQPLGLLPPALHCSGRRWLLPRVPLVRDREKGV